MADKANVAPINNKSIDNESNTNMSKDLERFESVEVNNYDGITTRTVLVFLSLCLIAVAQLMNIVASGALATDIAAAIGGSQNTVWLTQALTITVVVLGPPVSSASDLWGRKWFLVSLTALSFAGCLIVSRAESMGVAILGEVIAGIGYGAQPLVFAIASEIIPRQYRPAAQGGLNVAQGLGALIALLSGSAMIKDFDQGFRVYWYMVAAIFGVSTILCALLYKPPHRDLELSMSMSEKLRSLDWIAYTLLAIGSICFVMGLSWAKNPYPWSSAHVLAPLLIGVAVLICLAIYEWKVRYDGLFHHRPFKMGRNFALTLFIMLIDGLAFFAANGYLAFQVSVLYETDPILIGLHFGLVFISAIASSFLVSFYSSKTKDVRYPVVLALVLFTAFFACMATTTPGSSTAVWGYPVILGAGMGISLTCLVTIAQLSTPPDLIALTSGLVIGIRSLGGVIGLAVFISIFSSLLSTKLPAYVAQAVVPLELPPTALNDFIGALSKQDQQALMTIQGVTPKIIGAGVAALEHAYTDSFRGVWIAAAAFSAVGVIASLFLQRPKTITMHVDAPLQPRLTGKCDV